MTVCVEAFLGPSWVDRAARFLNRELAATASRPNARTPADLDTWRTPAPDCADLQRRRSHARAAAKTRRARDALAKWASASYFGHALHGRTPGTLRGMKAGLRQNTSSARESIGVK